MRRFSFLLFLLITTHAFTQNEVDALRYSNYDGAVSARSLGMGGAFGAAGGDASSFYLNPAGIGVFRRGMAELSFGLQDVSTRAKYEGTEKLDARTKFILNQACLLGMSSNSSANKRFNYGVSYAKLNTFHENILIEGEAQSTLLIPFALQASGNSTDDIYDALPWTSALAYDTYALDLDDTTQSLYRYNANGNPLQRKQITRSGAQGETAFALGWTNGDKWYFGLSLKMMSIRFDEDATHTETFSDSSDVRSFAYHENLSTTGTGFNIMAGVIAFPTPWLRAGASIQSGTRMTLQDSYTTDMSTNYFDENYTSTSPELINDWSLRIPSRMRLHSTWILGKHGLINVDYERAHIQSSVIQGLGDNTFDYGRENEKIGEIFRSTNILRAGGELRWRSYYFLRGGISWRQNPLSEASGEAQPAVLGLHAGCGYRSDYFTADLGISSQVKQSAYYLYDPAYASRASLSSQHFMAMLSVGMKFQ